MGHKTYTITKNIFFLCLLLICHNTFSSIQAPSLCVAHRGHGAYFENSSNALWQAYQVGARAIEFDVHFTREGIPILSHDPFLARLVKNRDDKICPKYRNISKLNLDTIQSNCLLKNGEPIPTLEQVFNTFDGLGINLFLELKERPTELGMQIIADYAVKNPFDLTIISFKPKALDLVIDNYCQFPILQEVPLVLLNSRPVPVPNRYNGMGSSRFTEKQIRYLQSRDKIVNVWTINNKVEMEKYFNWGVNFVTSDNIEQCLELEADLLTRVPQTSGG